MAELLEQSQLKVLPLDQGERRCAERYLVYRDPDCAGPVARRLGELLMLAIR